MSTGSAKSRAGLLAGADVDPATGRLLSVAQLQVVLRGRAGATVPLPAGVVPAETGPAGGDPGHTAARACPTGSVALALPEPPRGAGAPGEPDREPGWSWLTEFDAAVLVVGAHPGTGCSTVALAIAEAAAAETGGHLVEWAQPGACGLAAVSDTELGVDASGRWRAGRRGGLTVSRPAAPVRTPPPHGLAGPDGPGSVTGPVVVDVGHRRGIPAGWDQLPGRPPVVVVCQANLPGVGRAEAMVADLGPAVAAIAVLGPTRWPKVLRAGLGPRLRSLRRHQRLVTVPVDRRLSVHGLTSAGLPRPVSTAGTRLWEHVRGWHEPSRATGDADYGSTVTAVTSWPTAGPAQSSPPPVDAVQPRPATTAPAPSGPTGRAQQTGERP